MRLDQFLALDTLVVADFAQFAAAFFIAFKATSPTLRRSVAPPLPSKPVGFEGAGTGTKMGYT